MDQDKQLCVRCGHAVPSADGICGCPWSLDLLPVDGWTARRVLHPPYRKGGLPIESFEVIKCPLFIPDVPFDGRSADDDGMRKLAYAIVLQAVKDWKALCAPNAIEHDGKNFRELRRFFRKEVDDLLDVDGFGAAALYQLERYKRKRKKEVEAHDQE